jgi:hypothetical protein
MSEGLDPRLKSYFEKLISDVDNAKLLEETKNHRELTKGFRPGHVDASVLRKRLLAALATDQQSASVLSVLRGLSLQASLISVLSADAIKHGLESLPKCFGELPVFAAMAIDPRPEVNQMASAFLKRSPTPQQGAPEDLDPQPFLVAFAPFINVVASHIGGDDSETSSASPRARTEQTRNQSKANGLSPEQMQARINADPAVRRLRRDLADAQRQLSSVLQEKAGLESQRLALSADLTRIQAEHVELQRRFDSDLALRVEDLFARRLGDMFRRSSLLLQIEKGAGDETGDGAIAKARQALAEQRVVDGRYGRRSALTEKLAEAKALLQEIGHAALEALRPSPVLFDSRRALERVIADLETRLELTRMVPQSAPPGFTRFCEQLGQSSSAEDLSKLRQQLDAIDTAGQWGAKELSDARERLSHAALRLYADHLEVDVDKHWATLSSASPLNALRVLLARSQPTHLLIDGHNVLFQLKPVWGRLFDDGIPRQRARRHLVGELTDLCKTYPLLEVDLWFDSDELAESTQVERLRVRFSGGQGPDRADRAIEAALRGMSLARAGRAPQKAVFVVTADRDVQAATRSLLACAMHPHEFALLVGA